MRKSAGFAVLLLACLAGATLALTDAAWAQNRQRGGGPGGSPSTTTRPQQQQQPRQPQQPRQQQDQNPDFWLRNNSNTQIDNVNVSAPEDTSWGRDRLGQDEVILPGTRTAIRLSSPGKCMWDVRVVYHDKREEERRNVNLCGLSELAFDGSNARVPQNTQPSTPPPNADNGGGKPTGTPTQPQQPQRPPQQTQRPQPSTPPGASQDQNPDFWLANRSNTRIDRINVSPPEDTQWGTDRLGDDVVEPGARYAVRLNTPGKCVWDVRVIYHDSREEERRNVNLCGITELAFDGSNAHAPENTNPQQPNQPPRTQPISPPATPPTPPRPPQQTQNGDQNPDFWLANRSNMRIDEINVSAPEETNWGQNRLGTAQVAPGDRFAVRLSAPGRCRWDVRVVYQDKREEERRNTDTCAVAELAFDASNAHAPEQNAPPTSPSPTSTQNTGTPSLTVVNGGPAQINELYVAPASENKWGEDRLGQGVIANGQRFDVELARDKGCSWDIRVVYLGGRSDERRNQNLCAVHELSFSGTVAPGTLLSTGTGFYVSRDGHILTNRHVVDGCGTVAIARPSGDRIPLKRVGEDAVNDLALLQIAGTVTPTTTFRGTNAPPVRAGDRVVVIGYPVRQLLGDVNVTEGVISSMRGPRGDATRFQYTAPVQGGNSGGPIFDETGLVIGVVVSRIESLPGGRQAQNINFGIQEDVVRRFLLSLGVTMPEAVPGDPRRTSDILERSQPVVLPLDCVS